MQSNINDIVEIKGEIGRIRQHLDLIKEDSKEQSIILTNIENTLVGNSLNGNKGVVFLINDIDKRVKHLEFSNLKREQTENNAKWVAGFVFAALSSLMLWIVTHLPKNA